MKKSKKIILLILGVILLAAGILWIGLHVATTANHALQISKLLQPILDAENQAMRITASAEINGHPVSLESDIFLVTEEERKYLCIDQNGTAVYIADNVLFLENGKAFKLSGKMQIRTDAYEALLPQIGTLFEVLSVTVEETENKIDYCIAVTGEQVDALLAAVPLGELPVDSIDTLNLCLTEKDGKLDQISFSGNGRLEGNAAALHVTLSGFQILARGDYPIPEEVKKSAATVDPEELFSLTEDLYRLVLALDKLADTEALGGTLDLTVDCGLLQLDTQMELSDLNAIYDAQMDPKNLQALPAMLGWLCMEGEITCTPTGDAYIYRLVLDQEAMEELSKMILPELAQYGGDFTEGSASITVDAGEITSMHISLEGSINILLVQIPIAVSAGFSFE